MKNCSLSASIHFAIVCRRVRQRTLCTFDLKKKRHTADLGIIIYTPQLSMMLFLPAMRGNTLPLPPPDLPCLPFFRSQPRCSRTLHTHAQIHKNVLLTPLLLLCVNIHVHPNNPTQPSTHHLFDTFFPLTRTSSSKMAPRLTRIHWRGA